MSIDRRALNSEVVTEEIDGRVIEFEFMGYKVRKTPGNYHFWTCKRIDGKPLHPKLEGQWTYPVAIKRAILAVESQT